MDALEKAKEVRKKLDDNGLITWSIGSPIGKIKLDADFEAHLDTFRHTLEVAHILGAENLRLFSFYTKGFDPRRDGYLYGWNFAEQWEYAIAQDPEMIFVTGWNEST